jgi:L-threonylcarbamoyladenylate synthase
MPEVLDWQLGDPRLALERAVRELTAGKLVAFPTEIGYCVAASLVQPQALAALGQLPKAEEAVLAVRSVEDALRWAPWMSATARRMARRCWPGPVTLVIESAAEGERDGDTGDLGFAGGKSTIRLRMPAHEALLHTLEQLGEPLVVCPVGNENGSAEQLAAALQGAVELLITDEYCPASSTPTVVQIRGDAWTVERSGTITAEMLQSMLPTTIIFVCTGNTCRSPLAEALCKKLLAERMGCEPSALPERGFKVLSAGLAAMMGAPASFEAVEVAGDCGVDLSSHRSQPLTADLLARADYVFAMTSSHLQALEPFMSPAGPEMRLLAPDGGDVPDPIGYEREVYEECAQLILGHLQDRLEDIRPPREP